MQTGHEYHKDSFGRLQSVLTGGSTWTLRLIRNTKVAVPHIAKNDVFTYIAQLNHDKKLDTNLDGFHIHFLPIGTVTAGQVIAIDYKWVWLTSGDVFPDTLPNSGTATIYLATGEQYKYLIKNIVANLTYPTGEDYSSELFIECTRRNDGQDTYPGEFALLDGDVHYKTNHLGSYNEFND
jgi:hypothetical protein